MNQELISSINLMIPNGKRLELPTDTQFANYPAVKKALTIAGGKYKKCGFEFTDDAEAVQIRLVGGEVINDQKKYQFFATPEAVVEMLLDRADVRPRHRVLEPSAGQGAIVNALIEITEDITLVELMPENVRALERQDYSVLEMDFLTMTPVGHGLFDRIVANPPFTKNQDIDHIRHMYSFLKPGGRLVSIASPSWTYGSQKKQVEFREWLDELGAEVEEIPAGAFKESGTGVRSMMITIDKSA